MNHRVGDKSKAICSKCEKIVKTTFKYKHLPNLKLKGNNNVYKRGDTVLSSLCDECGTVCSVPMKTKTKDKK